MPQGYLPNEVENAIDTLRDYVDKNKTAQRSAAKPRSWYDNRELQKDRVRYHKASLDELRIRLLGTVESSFYNY